MEHPKKNRSTSQFCVKMTNYFNSGECLHVNRKHTNSLFPSFHQHCSQHFQGMVIINTESPKMSNTRQNIRSLRHNNLSKNIEDGSQLREPGTVEGGNAVQKSKHEWVNFSSLFAADLWRCSQIAPVGFISLAFRLSTLWMSPRVPRKSVERKRRSQSVIPLTLGY